MTWPLFTAHVRLLWDEAAAEKRAREDADAQRDGRVPRAAFGRPPAADQLALVPTHDS